MATVMALNSSLAARAAFSARPLKQQARTSHVTRAESPFNPNPTKMPDSALECECLRRSRCLLTPLRVWFTLGCCPYSVATRNAVRLADTACDNASQESDPLHALPPSKVWVWALDRGVRTHNSSHALRRAVALADTAYHSQLTISRKRAHDQWLLGESSSISCLYCLTSYVICFADVKTLPGISAPFENIFDPADLIGRADGSVRPVQEIKRWREAEITHSRVAMLAAVGFVVGEQLEVGGVQQSMPCSGPAAALEWMVPPPPFAIAHH